MPSPKVTSLYHEETDSTLIVPPYFPLPEGNFVEGVGKGVSFYLLIMNPKSYVKVMWKEKTQGVLDFKWFLFNTMQIPQSRSLSNPDATIRAEHAKHDLAEVGIDGTLSLSIPQKDICLTSSAYIRRVYGLDYELGDYD